MRHFLLFIILCSFLSFSGSASSPDSLKYVDAENFRLIGKGFSDTQTLYERLPSRLENVTRPPVWQLSKNCSGLAVRFRTDSKVIAARWEVLEDVVMNHFAMTGIKGLDLYCLKDGEWLFVKSGRPEGKTTDAIIIDHMPGNFEEYMLYLPLYDGLVSLEIGIDSAATIGLPLTDSPRRGKPVVFYGTSITQGGCASRTGMSYPNQLSRMLDREIINLGFSGNGKLDLEIAEAMATIDASCFVMDCLPNVTPEQMNEKYERFVQILREKHPYTPILLVENIHYTNMMFDQTVHDLINDRNKTLENIYKKLKQSGDKHLFYLKADHLIGDDLEGTVDGGHLTDLGFYRIAQNMFPVIKVLLE